MTENPLQQALTAAKERETHGGPRVRNLVESSFHSAGFFLDKELLKSAFSDWVDVRDYRPLAEGRVECRNSVAGYYRQASGNPDCILSGEDVFCTASSSESYAHLFGEFCSPGDNILLPLPSYPLFEDLAAHAGLEPRFYPLDQGRNWAPDLDVMHALMDSRTRFVVLISPNNPCGSVLSAPDLEKILALCLEESVMVISDEVFSEFLYPPLDRLPRAWELSRGAPVFTLNGISKMFACPDLKLGWIMASTGPGGITAPGFPSRDEICSGLSLRLDTYLNGNDFSQFLLPELLGPGAYLARKIGQALGESRERLISGRLAGLEGWRLLPPQGGMHFVLSRRSRRGPDDETLAISLVRNHGLYTHPGYLYGMDEGCHLVLSLLGGLEPDAWDRLAMALTEPGIP